MYSLTVQIRNKLNRSLHGFSSKTLEKMVGLEGFEPSTIGLKVRNGENNRLII